MTRNVLGLRRSTTWWNTIRVVWPIFIVHLIVVLAAGVLWQHYFGTLSKNIKPKDFGAFIAGLSHWDATWFLSIAKDGYSIRHPFAAAFFPAYPLSMSVVAHALSFLRHGEVLGAVGDKTYLASGLVISNISFFVSLACLYVLGRMQYSDRQTRRGLWLLALFPTSYYFSAAYSESLFLVLIAAAYLLVYHRRFGWAGVCIGLATLTRNLGIFAVPCLLVVIWRDFRQDRRWKAALVHSLLLSVTPVISLCLFFAWLYRIYGNPLMFLEAESRHWQRHFDFIWTSLHLDYYHDPLGFLTAVIFLVLLLAATRRIPFEQWLLSAFFLLIPMSSVAGKYPMSMARFVIVLFPLFLFFGGRLRTAETYFAVMAASSVLLVWLTGLFASAHWIA